MNTVSAHIFLKISFTVTAVLGIIPNVIILLIFLKNAPKELHSYGIFLVNFAITELICCAATWLSMNRLYFISMEDFWFVPIGPCNYLSTDVCQWSAATLNACLMNIMTLIPMSFAYRYFVINHGTPAMRMIILIVGASLISPILAVPLLSTSVILDEYGNVPLSNYYHHFQFDKSSLKNQVIQIYIQLGVLTSVVNFVFAWLIIRKLKKFESILAKKTMSMHQMLTKALIFHTLVHLILVISTVLFGLEAAKVIRFPYCDVFPNLIYSTVPFLNGMVCLCYVPHFRKVLRSWDPRKSVSLRNIMMQNSQESGERF